MPSTIQTFTAVNERGPTMKYADTLAEAASTIANHGFAEDQTGNDGHPWNALVTVTPVTLRNIGEHEIAQRMEAEWGPQGRLVWVVEHEDGHVRTERHCLDLDPGHTALIEREWNDFLTAREV